MDIAVHSTVRNPETPSHITVFMNFIFYIFLNRNAGWNEKLADQAMN